MIELNEILFGHGIKERFKNIYLRILLIIFLCLFIAVLLVGGIFAYTVLYIYILTLLTSFLWCLISYKGIHYELEIDKKRIIVDESVNLRMTIKNNFHLFYPYVKISDSFLGNLFESGIYPTGMITFEKVLSFKRYGRYTIGPVKLEIKDGFGIFRFTRTIDKLYEIKVYPKLLDLGLINFNAKQVFGNTKSKDLFREDYTSVKDLRDYQYGDIIKKVHWRATAKRGNLTVKNYDLLAENNVCIYLDRCKINYADEIIDEKAIECCISLIKYCLENYLPVKLITSKFSYYAKSMDDYSGILEKILDLWPDDNTPFEKVINDIGAGSMESAAIITSNLSSGLINVLPGYASQGIGIIIFWIYNGDITEKYKNSLNFLRKFGIDFKIIK